MTTGELESLKAGINVLSLGDKRVSDVKAKLDSINADEDSTELQKKLETLRYINALEKQLAEYRNFVNDIQNNNLEANSDFNKALHIK